MENSFGLVRATDKADIGKTGSAKSGSAKNRKSGETGRTASRSAATGQFVSKGGKPPKGSKGKGGEGYRDAALGRVARKVSATVLHHSTRPTLDLLQTNDAVAVTHYNQVEGYLVAPGLYVELVDRAERAEARETELSSTVTLLLAAAQTGVPIPSDMLERVMPNVDVAERWREIAEFAASFPVRISAGEHGEPITRASLSHVGGPIEETGSDDDLDL